MTVFLGIGAAIALASALAAAWIDIRSHRLPNELVAVVAATGVVVFVISSVAESSTSRLTNAASAAVIMAVPLLVAAVAAPKLVGFGDVKLAGALGLWLGGLASSTSPFETVGLAFLVAFIGAIPEGAFRTATKRAAGVGFGPYLVAGALVAALANPWT